MESRPEPLEERGTQRSARVLAVVVSWNSGAHVARAVESLRGIPGLLCVVVDNASSDASAELAASAGAEVVRLPRNIGFGPACNLGLLGRPSQAVLFLNPDAALLDGARAIETLLHELETDPTVAAVAPGLVGEGQERFQLRRLPTVGSLVREASFLNRLWPNNPGLLDERYLNGPRDQPLDVEQPAAAAVLIRRDVLERLDGFDPDFAPAWFEDVDLCARILGLGLRIRFVPEARAEHAGGTAMRALLYRDFLPLYTRNLLRYLSKHASPPKRFAARTVLGAGAVLRLLALLAVRGDHPRRDAGAAYVRVLRGLVGLGWKSSLLV